jgi:hypothetical protein
LPPLSKKPGVPEIPFFHTVFIEQYGGSEGVRDEEGLPAALERYSLDAQSNEFVDKTVLNPAVRSRGDVSDLTDLRTYATALCTGGGLLQPEIQEERSQAETIDGEPEFYPRVGATSRTFLRRIVVEDHLVSPSDVALLLSPKPSSARSFSLCSPTSGMGAMTGSAPSRVAGGRSPRNGPTGESNSRQRFLASSWG